MLEAGGIVQTGTEDSRIILSAKFTSFSKESMEALKKNPYK
jgi:hypothetical protein